LVRAFIAVDIYDEEAVRKILAVQDELQRVNPNGLKPVEPENLHITLRFLGEIDEETVQYVVGVLEKLDEKPFTVSLEGLGYFPGSGRINVVWVGVSEGGEQLTRIYNWIEKELAGLRLERERFTPHLTICRIKSVRDRNALLAVIEKNRSTEFGKQLVDKVSLKKSVLTPTGPVYSDIMVKRL